MLPNISSISCGSCLCMMCSIAVWSLILQQHCHII
jgi:hypothetical protein